MQFADLGGKSDDPEHALPASVAKTLVVLVLGGLHIPSPECTAYMSARGLSLFHASVLITFSAFFCRDLIQAGTCERWEELVGRFPKQTLRKQYI